MMKLAMLMAVFKSLIKIGNNSGPRTGPCGTHQSESIDNLERIANIFNSYFSTIVKKTEVKIKHYPYP